MPGGQYRFPACLGEKVKLFPKNIKCGTRETGKRGRDHLLGEQGKMTGRKRGAKVSTIPRYIV